MLIGISLFSSGETIVVDVNGNGDHISLSSAINESEGGDIIRILDGKYFEEAMIINSNITIIGNSTETVQITSINGSILQIIGNDCVITNFTLIESHLAIFGNGTSLSHLILNHTNINMWSDNNSISNISMYSNGSQLLNGLYMIKNNYIENVTLNLKPILYYQDVHFSHDSPMVIQSNAAGVFLFNTSFIRIINNELSNNIGIFLSNSHHIEIQDNVFPNSNYGVLIVNSNENWIHGNQFFTMINGIVVLADSNIIENNTFVDNGVGVLIQEEDGKDNLVTNNQFINSPITVDEDNNLVNNNSVNGKLSIQMKDFSGTQNDPFILSGDFNNIILIDCSYIFIVNANISGEDDGVILERSNNITIANSDLTFQNGDKSNGEKFSGIILDGCNFININNNTIKYYSVGILFKRSNSNGLVTNSIMNCGEGVSISFSSRDNSIQSNSLIDNEFSIGLFKNGRNNISNNIIQGNHIDLLEGNYYVNNTMNGKKILYFEGMNNIVVSQEKNISMIILYSCVNVHIENTIIANGYIGILLNNCDKISITGNKIKNNSGDGIFATHCDGLFINNNEIFQNDEFGIRATLCINSTIRENTIWSNGNGMYINNKAIGHSTQKNDFSHNTIKNNDDVGIFIHHFGNWNSMNHNIISENNIGIVLKSYSNMQNGDSNVINFNQIANNSEFGLVYEDSIAVHTFYDNWWGNSSGPYQANGNPSGEGNEAYGKIDIKPWMREPNNLYRPEEDWSIRQIIGLIVIVVILIVGVIFIIPFFMGPSIRIKGKD